MKPRQAHRPCPRSRTRPWHCHLSTTPFHRRVPAGLDCAAIQLTPLNARWPIARPGVAEHLFAAEVILHAGDVCVASLLEELSAYAPVHAVLGNNDRPDVNAQRASETVELDLAACG